MKIRERSQITSQNIANRSKLRLPLNQVNIQTNNRHNVISSFSLQSWKVNHPLLILVRSEDWCPSIVSLIIMFESKINLYRCINVTTMQQLVFTIRPHIIELLRFGLFVFRERVQCDIRMLFCQRIESSFETYNKIKWLFSCVGVSTTVVCYYC